MNQLFLPLLLMLVVAIPLVLGSRKQKRAMQEQQQLLSSLAEGDRVMTTSGLYGTVADASGDTTIDIEIAPGVVTTWLRQAVREKVVAPAEEFDETGATGDTGATAEHGADAVEAGDTTGTGAADDKQSESQVAPSLEHGKK